jgi:hypothetical protein
VSELHNAAFRAGVWQVIEQRAKELKDQAKAELAALEVGDTVSGRFDGQVIAKATKTKGRTKLAVTDEQKLLEWVEEFAPTEIVRTVNPAYLKQIEARAKALGAPVNLDGELYPGLELQDGEPYVTVRREKDAVFLVAQLLSAGHLSLDGIKEIEA